MSIADIKSDAFIVATWITANDDDDERTDAAAQQKVFSEAVESGQPPTAPVQSLWSRGWVRVSAINYGHFC